jgi:outer membrane protein TolC
MRTLIFALCLAGTAVAVAQTDRVEEQVRASMQDRLTVRDRVLSLEESIQIALQHNLDVQITRLDPELAQFTLSATYASYDPSLSLSARYSYEESPGGIDTYGELYRGSESETESFGGAIGGLLPWGMSYSLGANTSDRYGTQPGNFQDFSNPLTIVTNQFVDVTDNYTVKTRSITNYATVPGRFPFENVTANVGVFELRQPLLKNFWTDATRLQIYLNKRNLKISELGLRAQLIATVTAVEEAYYNLIYAEEAVAVQEKALELAERLVAENRRRVEVGALAPLDERQAEAQAAASRADLLAARATRDTQQRILKNLLSDNYDDWKMVRLRPTGSLLAVPQTFNLQESWHKGMTQRPDLLQASLNLEKQDKIVSYQRNQLYPQLDAVGNFGYVGSEDTYRGATRQLDSTDNPYYSYGLQMTIPLGNTSAKNNHRSAKTTREQLELQYQQIEQTVLITIENAIATAKSSLERVEASRQARSYSEEALRAEEMKLEKGKSTSFVVLQLQRDLTATRSAEIRALADYNIALARLALNEGSSLQRHGIDVKAE